MRPEVLDLLKSGSFWQHESGISCKIEQNSIQTLVQLTQCLIDALPADNKYHIMMVKTNRTNITSSLRRVIIGERSTLYKWRLIK